MSLIVGSKGPLLKPTTAAQPWRRELVFMPRSVRCCQPQTLGGIARYIQNESLGARIFWLTKIEADWERPGCPTVK